MTEPNNLVLVDTSVWICFLARKKFLDIKKTMINLLEDDRVAIIGPIYLELIQGTRNQKEREETEVRLNALHWLKIEGRHWKQAADLAFKLRRKGLTISAIDAIISVVAVDTSVELLHYDSDYTFISKHLALKLFAITPS